MSVTTRYTQLLASFGKAPLKRNGTFFKTLEDVLTVALFTKLEARKKFERLLFALQGNHDQRLCAVG